MFNFSLHTINKLVVVPVLIVQLLSPIALSFSRSSANECCHKSRKMVNHSCCNSNYQIPVNSLCKNIEEQTQSFSQCNCVHKTQAEKSDLSTQKTFELQKFINILYVVDINSQTSNEIYLTSNNLTDNVHSPPIYLTISSFLI